MRRWYNYAFAVAVVALAAGVRVSTGQGYLEPSVTGTVRLCSAAEANRSLDVWLNNRDAGRTHKFSWALLVSGTKGSLSLRCHEWKQVSIYGVSAFGVRWNEFVHVVRIDESDRGSDRVYNYVIDWRAKRSNQSQQHSAMAWPFSVCDRRSSRG
jgi:hypothetical protein